MCYGVYIHPRVEYLEWQDDLLFSNFLSFKVSKLNLDKLIMTVCSN